MATPVNALNVGVYAAQGIYLTEAEFMGEPTGVDLGQIIPGGNAGEQKAALRRLIIRASGIADDYCNKPLGATPDVASGRYRVFGDSTIRVPAPNTPVVQVTDVKIGSTPATLTALTDLSGVWIGQKTITIPLATTAPASWPYPSKVYAAVTYVAGWACTTLTAAVTAGGTTLPVADPAGVFPGVELRLPDGLQSEVVTVAANYVTGSLTVPIVGTLTFPHPAGCGASSLPPAVKTAVIDITAALIRTRGSEAMVMASMRDTPGKTAKGQPGKQTNLDRACMLLADYRRVI